MQEKLLTPEQVAYILNISSKTLARWRWAGSGPRFIKIGGCVRYAESELQDFIEAGIRNSTSDTGSSPAINDSSKSDSLSPAGS